ncbi:MAG: hypothetical protein SAJ12_08515 [Jaaginema sp. PMC 1079.18]|nr:hypothetical protein [Jaaginema sp. PMC 1080.18]MEC4851041.1 hypothetical protein [Jaaginema sp. PMC 1079.18]MEC4866444.1 hypothetical protein [Jaaginema sp. PMC 1078.18]
MLSIQDIVRHALSTGWLPSEAEQHLRMLLQTTRYDRQDFTAFMKLQQAVMHGHVKQETRERQRQQQQNQENPPSTKTAFPNRHINAIASVALNQSLQVSC